ATGTLMSSLQRSTESLSRAWGGAGGGCSVRKCFGVRESRPYSGRRSPKSCRFFLLFAWQKLFFPRFFPHSANIAGICCVVIIMGFPPRLSNLGAASHDDRPRCQATLRLGLP